MIVDFVSVKQKLYQALNLFMAAEVKKRAPLLTMTSRHVIHEGDTSSFENADHVLKDMDLQKAASGFSLSRDEMARISFQEVFAQMQLCASEMASQMEKHFFSTLDREIPASNTVVAPVFSPDTLLEGLDKILIDFDDVREKPSLPSFLLHPDLVKKLQELDATLSEEDRRNLEDRRAAILDRKFEEYVDRENKRRLVD